MTYGNRYPVGSENDCYYFDKFFLNNRVKKLNVSVLLKNHKS